MTSSAEEGKKVYKISLDGVAQICTNPYADGRVIQEKEISSGRPVTNSTSPIKQHLLSFHSHFFRRLSHGSLDAWNTSGSPVSSLRNFGQQWRLVFTPSSQYSGANRYSVTFITNDNFGSENHEVRVKSLLNGNVAHASPIERVWWHPGLLSVPNCGMVVQDIRRDEKAFNVRNPYFYSRSFSSWIPGYDPIKKTLSRLLDIGCRLEVILEFLSSERWRIAITSEYSFTLFLLLSIHITSFAFQEILSSLFNISIYPLKAKKASFARTILLRQTLNSNKSYTPKICEIT